MEKVYLVMETDGYESSVMGAFLDKEKAEKYCNQLEILKEDDYYNFFVNEQELLDNHPDLEKPIAEYYSYYFSKDPDDKITEHELFEFIDMDAEEYSQLTDEQVKQKLVECNHPDQRWNNDKDTQKRIDQGDLIIEDTEYHVSVYSKNSFEEAREKALELWNKYENKSNITC